MADPVRGFFYGGSSLYFPLYVFTYMISPQRRK
jgi:hypothetical protein